MSRTVVEVIYSPERSARVEIFRRENGTFGFEEWRFRTEERCWAPFGRYSEAFIQDADSAVREAKGRVSWLADDLKLRAYSLSWIRELADDPSAEFLSASIPVFAAVARDAEHPNGLGEELEAKQILRVGGLYLVETVGESDRWHMGNREADGPITCWGNYGSLEDAIRGL